MSPSWSQQLSDRSWAADVEALGEVDAELREQLERLRVGYELRDGTAPDRAGEQHDRLDDLTIDRVAGEAADELAVDLEVVDRELPQRREGPEAGAEVVERHLEAEPAERLRERGGAVDVGDRRRLGDLDDQPARIDPARRELLLEQPHHARADRAPGEVHRQRERPAALAQDPERTAEDP